ncbi:hypothetical protein, partial [Acidisphaera rubrifaciens]|uniref:hypothetical protein n=1 Tax=Acidisphaera rubrifaciens TaxID=50715 RepID=UPI0006627F58
MTAERRGSPFAFGSIRSRLILVLWVSAIPLVTLTGILTWRDYQSTLRDVEANAAIAREDAVAQARASLYATRHILAVLGRRLAPTAGVDCGVTLRDAALFASNRDEVLALLNPAGEVVCASDTAAAASVAQSWRDRAARAQAEGRASGDTATVWSISATGVGWMLGVAVPVGASLLPPWASAPDASALPAAAPSVAPPDGARPNRAGTAGAGRGTMLAALPVA